MQDIKKAFIFAAGLGTRMQPLTNNLPKPLIKVAGKCLLDYQIDLVIDAGIKQIAINCFYKAELIKGHIQKYLEKGIDIKIFEETERLETGGGLMNAKDFINNEIIFTLNSDVILRYKNINPLKKMAKIFDEKKHDILMLVVDKKNSVGFYDEGSFNLDDNNILNDKNKHLIFTGIEIINTNILNNYSGKKIFSLSEIFKNKLAEQKIGGVEHDDKWLHVGCLKGLEEAEKFFRASGSEI